MSARAWIGAALLLGFLPDAAGYPIYGSEDTGIRRLEYTRLAHEGTLEGRGRVPGETLGVDEVDLRLLERRDLELPPADAELTARVRELLGEEAEHYSVSVLDLTDPDRPAYAEIDGEALRNPGSVGKLAVAVALFQALADAWPDDIERRRAALHDTVVTADDFIVSDGHDVVFFDPASRTYDKRPLRIGDRGNLWEFLDWMLSASSNASAAIVQKQVMLLKRFGREYPPSETDTSALFAAPKSELAALFEAALIEPVARNGLDLSRLRQGSFFTRTGKSRVPGTTSYASTRELVRLLVRLEQGRLVDAFSSREIKRLLYMTERRIRYASSPALRDSAVYFKSGSLYACEPEAGFKCRKYHGNKLNLMNSVAIVESPARGRRLHYLVALTSNVLRRNSAVDHQTFATRIHRLLEARHAP